VIQLGRSSCDINFDWDTVNPVGTSAVSNSAGKVLATGNSGLNKPFSVKYNNEVFYLKNSGQQLDFKNTFSTCASATEWNGSVCQKATCHNGASNPPMCTFDEKTGECNNGAVNPPICKKIPTYIEN
ncbi:MAG: hypothetical protein ABIS26_02600, partial [Candidatus Paceibacterota bacterium]